MTRYLAGKSVVVTGSGSRIGRAVALEIVKAGGQQFGRIDGVVSNAGIVRDAIFHKMTPDQFSSVIDVHLKGSFNVSRAAAEYFRRQESGAYVHMTSTSGLIGNVGQANYSAAKLGIVGLSKSIALDMQRYHVRSNCISPFAWTGMTATIPADTPDRAARVEKFRQMTPDKVGVTSTPSRQIIVLIHGLLSLLFEQIS